jgi:hypothetical protein
MTGSGVGEADALTPGAAWASNTVDEVMRHSPTVFRTVRKPARTSSWAERRLTPRRHTPRATISAQAADPRS